MPFVLRAPGLAPGVRSDPVDLTDVAPTLASLAGAGRTPPAGAFTGRDLLAAGARGRSAGAAGRVAPRAPPLPLGAAARGRRRQGPDDRGWTAGRGRALGLKAPARRASRRPSPAR